MKIVKEDYSSRGAGSIADACHFENEIGDFLPEDLDENGKLIFNKALLSESSRINIRAFDKIRDLVKELDIPEGVSWAGVIEGLKNLETISIPKTVKILCVKNCPSLKSAKLSEGLESFSKGGAFNNCGKLNSLVLPRTVESFYSNSFIGCNSLKKIVVKGDKLRVYDFEGRNNEVFCNCKNIKEVKFLNIEFGKEYWLEAVEKNADAFLLIQSELLEDESFVKKCLVAIAYNFGVDKAKEILNRKNEIEEIKHDIT